MKKIIFFAFVFFALNINAQINTRTGGSTNVLPNSPTTNTNVGIGTNIPKSKLDVEGNISIGVNYSGSIIAPVNGAIIEGNVGIGTTNPTEKLEVNGNIRSFTGIFSRALPNGQFFSSNEERMKESMSLTAGSLVDPVTGGRTFSFLDMPASNFNDKSFVWLSIDDRDYNSRYRLTAQTDGNTWFFIGNKNQEPIYELNELNDEVKITMSKPNSYFGIGTNSFIDGNDTYRLSVNGAIRAHRVKVYTTWADFVFEKDYNLPSLQDVEQHIKEKGHLKDIPSAQEVAENGIELGEMNKKLLQKIEELTLYVIELNRELEKVKEQLKKE